MLQTLLCSEDEVERRFAVKAVLKLRGDRQSGDTGVRPRKTPDVNLKATKLTVLIDWKTVEIHEPVLTCSLNQDQIRSFLDSPMQVPAWSVHAQAVERTVKKTTEASISVFGFERRDGFIRAADAHRDIMPQSDSKKDLIKLTGKK